MSDEVTKRNIGALAQSARDERTRLDALVAEVNSLRAKIGAQDATISELRSQLGALIARTVGSGPTGPR